MAKRLRLVHDSFSSDSLLQNDLYCIVQLRRLRLLQQSVTRLRVQVPAVHVHQPLVFGCAVVADGDRDRGEIL